jgi:hypothetical protein
MKNKITISVVAGVAISTLSSAALASTSTAVKLEMLGAEASNPILEQLSPEMQQTLDAYRAKNGEIIPGQFLACGGDKGVCPPPMRHERNNRSLWQKMLDMLGVDSTSSIAAITQSKTDKDFS